VRDPEGALQGCVKREGGKIFGGQGKKKKTKAKTKKEPLAKASFLFNI
jgi:hypothetical protein